ncbi:MAG TPA: adenylate/guanylate cyclase domain-containing protein [Saprospiraceae bacterium]|nr:adenylate/guanylate cyclase domain-containing protein [Saprospiraceae bacterium]
MAEKEVRKLAAVMFTDIEGYTAFVQKDEAAALKKVAIHRQFLEKYTAEYSGRVIAFYGDGSLSIYESALDAVHCAIAMQKAYKAEHPIPVRIGIHVGDIVFKDETVFGDGVNIASRIQASGIPGSIYVSGRVQSELTNHPEIRTRSLGRKKLKNVSTPIDVFVVTNEGLSVPSAMTQIPDLKKYWRYVPILIVGIVAWWYFSNRVQGNLFGDPFTVESISVPLFTNNTGDPSFDHVSQMASHWITKELSSTPEANVVSYESASEMIHLSGLSLTTARGRKQYASLTGAVNIVEANFMKIGRDSIMMSGWITNLHSGKIIQPLEEVRCSTEDPMECIQAMSGNIKGYWASRNDKVLTPPNYDAYKAYMAARSAWRSDDTAYVKEQLNKAISLDKGFIDPYFLMLDFFYNQKQPQAAFDTIKVIRRKFTELDDRERNMLNYHTADVNGKNDEAYAYFLNEYAVDPRDMFTNNSAMVLALMYRHDPRQALTFFKDIPSDSIQIAGCSYCADRLELAMWAALDIDSMSLADLLAPKIKSALQTRKDYGTLIMYYVYKNDTTQIDQLISDSRSNPAYEESWEYLNYLAGRLFLLRDNAAMASRYAQRSIEAHLPYPGLGRMLGKSYYLNNQLDKALATYKSARILNPDDTRILVEMGMVYAKQGNKAEMKKIIDQLESLKPPFDYGATEYNVGRIYAIAGEKDKAVARIEASINKGQKYDLWITFDHDPDLMELREYPAYQKLMERFK